jgi:O-antigen biosynthesis protein
MMSRRITIVASELLGRAGTGGAGTADSLLAVALGRRGHDVKLVVATGRDIGELNPEWTRIYADAGVDVRMLERIHGVRPSYLAPTLEVYHALRDMPPEIAVVNDWRGLGYAAMRARQTGLALTSTAFVVHCHGPGRVLAEFAQKVPDTVERFGEEIAERASIELADAVVSPSAWLLDWMRGHNWPVPDAARVIQYVRQSAALDETPARAPTAPRIRRLAFFGQLREGKGIRIFVAALHRIDPILLEGVELVFLGGERARWTGAGIMSALAAGVKERLSGVRFEPCLEREAALELLREPGTLAVMPSLLDNSPNTVSECIEHGIPFVATETGGIPELVAPEDRSRVLCRPTTEHLAAALTRALLSAPAVVPARPARGAEESLAAWLEVVQTIAPAPRRHGRTPAAVTVVATGEEGARRARRLAERTRSAAVDVVRAASRRDGLSRTSADWIVFLDDDDGPDDGMLDTLVAAQAASGADVVTAAVRRAHEPGGVELFLGDPGSLGLVENRYGVLGLMRTSAVVAEWVLDDGLDPDWPLFARLALAGARIVSVPIALSTYTGTPGRVGDVPGDGLSVLEAFEEAAEPRDVPQLAATLAATLARLLSQPPAADGVSPHLPRRLARVVRSQGFRGLWRRTRPRFRPVEADDR